MITILRPKLVFRLGKISNSFIFLILNMITILRPKLVFRLGKISDSFIF